MYYDLTIKSDRAKFVKRANSLLLNQRKLVELTDESDRTLRQNGYLHVLCRILAADTGQTEEYAKQVYFKELANPDLFLRSTKDPITKKMIRTVRSTTELSILEMSIAIKNFHQWAAEQGYYLPEANFDSDGKVTFSSKQDEDSFRQAQVQTSKVIDI